MTEQLFPRPPKDLLDLAFGFQRSKVLFALVEFEIPTLLAGGPLALSDLAAATSLHPVAADRLLNSCVALNLLERVNSEFRNSTLSEQFLVKGKPTYLGDQCLEFDSRSYPLWSDLAAQMRLWRPGRPVNQSFRSQESEYQALKARHNLSLMVGYALARAFDFSQHRTMLDLGGGTAAMSIGICRVDRSI